MSKRKNLKWMCRRCERTHADVELEHSTELEKKCSFCGTKTWCFLVAASRLVKGKKTDLIVEDDIAEVVESKPPSEQPLEAESTEEIEAIEEVAEEALEEILEVIERQEESPGETAPAEGLEPIAEEVAAESPETEVEVVKPDFVEAVTAVGLEAAIKLDKKANIARLEAELEALNK